MQRITTVEVTEKLQLSDEGYGLIECCVRFQDSRSGVPVVGLIVHDRGFLHEVLDLGMIPFRFFLFGFKLYFHLELKSMATFA